MEGLEAAEDVMEEVSIDDITECTPKAARAVELESTGGGYRLVKKAKEHLEAEKSLRGRTAEELKVAKRNLAKQSRRYRARRTIQKLQKVMNKQAGGQALHCDKEGETTSDRQKLEGGAGKMLEEQVPG